MKLARIEVGDGVGCGRAPTRATRSSAATARWSRPRSTSPKSGGAAGRARSSATTPPSRPSRRRSPTPGIDSYAMFLMALSSGETERDERARQAAHDELASATAAYEQALQLRDLPSRAELETRARVLRDHARAMLGREPGRDLPADLRTLRVPRADYDERLRELIAVLEGAGSAVGDDPLADARRFLMSPPSIHIEQQREWPMPGARWAGRLDEADASPMPGDAPQPVEASSTRPSRPSPRDRQPSSSPQIEALERELAEQQQRARRARSADARARGRARQPTCRSCRPRRSRARSSRRSPPTARAPCSTGKVPLVLDGVLDRIRPDACDAAVETLAARGRPAGDRGVERPAGRCSASATRAGRSCTGPSPSTAPTAPQSHWVNSARLLSPP